MTIHTLSSIRRRRRAAVIVVVLFAAQMVSMSARPQTDVNPTPPVLTDMQRLQFRSLSQQLEIAQLKAQLAQHDFDAARDAIGKLVLSLRIDGYTLDLATLTYRPNPQETKDK